MRHPEQSTPQSGDLQVALAAITGCTRAVMRARSEKSLVEQVCSIIVEAGYRFCWVAAAEQDEQKTVRPLAWAGYEDGYLSRVKITWSDSEYGRGPTGTSIRTAKPVVFQDVLENPDFTTWRTEAHSRGYRSNCALPLIAGGAPFGALSIYADQPTAFGEDELQLLSNLAEILSFGITNLRERQRAKDALQEVSELNEQVIDSAHEGIIVHDQKLRCVMWNPFMEELTGVPASEMIGGFSLEKFPYLRELGVEAGLLKALAGEPNASDDVPFVVPHDGRTVWVSGRHTPLRDASGQVTKVLVTLRDVTERKKAEEALRHSEQRLQQAVRASQIGIIDHDHFTDICYWSPRQREIYGFSPDESVTLPMFFDHVYPEDREAIVAAIHRSLDPGGDGLFDVEHRIVRCDGNIRWVSIRSQTIFEGKGGARHPVRTIGAVVDITERKYAEQALQQSEQRLQQAVRVSHIGIFDHDHNTDTIYWSPEQRKIYGFGPDEAVTLAVYFDHVYAGDHEAIAAAVRRAHDPGGDGLFDIEHRIIRRDGDIRWLSTRSQTVFEGKGSARRTVRTIGAVVDITERKRAEQALREAEEKYREIFDNAVLGIYQSLPSGRYLSVNQAMARMHGYTSPQEMTAMITDIEHQVYVDPSRRREFIRLLEEQGTVRDFVVEIYRKDGSRGWAMVNARAVRDGQGKVLYYEGTQEDITERKRLEAQYEQAQKMEAIGRLAGGVAHDFNNILGVILGYSELTQGQLAPGHPVARNIARIREAAERAGSLTRQLLTFSRQQVVHPRVLDLNKVVSNLVEMLKRLVGEDVTISLKLGDQLGLVKADPGQIEQILMNLGVNSRDAMPTGGKIVIETNNVTLDDNFMQQHAPVVPGAYVMLSFGDTGRGIDEENLPRIFEPFFTTKDLGKGTGLGLATVYGIVKQSNGYIRVYSERNKGTIFKICFPRVEDTESVLEPKLETKVEGGRETILLVEDEAALRDVAATLLKASGYKILQAENATAALGLAQAFGERIDLLLTDVIMPAMSGTQLCSRLQESRHGIKVLYMSGYAGDWLGHYGQFGSETALLEKPFTKNSLLKKVRSVLDS